MNVDLHCMDINTLLEAENNLSKRVWRQQALGGVKVCVRIVAIKIIGPSKFLMISR